MGEIIRRDAAADDIVADAKTTLTNAKSRGGRWNELAVQRLGPVLGLFGSVEAKRAAAVEALTPLEAEVDSRNRHADATLGKQYDLIWNEIGRPAYDAALSVLFPDGIGYYAEGDTEGQPDRMEILVELLKSGIHPKLSEAAATAAANEIKAAGDALRTAVEAAGKPAAQVKVLGKVRVALAKVIHSELSNLKRLYKADGFSEAEIHTVIPDRPSKSKKVSPT